MLIDPFCDSNMHLFDSEGRIKKYHDVKEILKDFYALRLLHYQKRKDYLSHIMGEDLKRISNKVCILHPGMLP